MIISYFLRGSGFILNLGEFTLNCQRDFVIKSHILDFDDAFPDQTPELANYGTLRTWNSTGSYMGNSCTFRPGSCGPSFLWITGIWASQCLKVRGILSVSWEPLVESALNYRRRCVMKSVVPNYSLNLEVVSNTLHHVIFWKTVTKRFLI